MRILFTFEGGAGHFNPLVPIARAAEAAGHTVAVACAPMRRTIVELAGFDMFPAGIDVGGTPETAVMEAHYESIPSISEREAYLLREGFAGWYAQAKARDIPAICAEWQPDLLVRDEIDFGSAAAAEHMELPHASVTVDATGAFVRHDLITGPLNRLRAKHGLPPDPDLAMLSRYLVFSPLPARFRDPAFPLPATAHPLRLLPAPAAEDTLPAWAVSLPRTPEAPTVYFSLGTAFGSTMRDVYTRVVEGLRALPITLIVTMGGRLDPASFGEQPAHVHIERYLPQTLLLPHCDLFVSHGGSGGVMEALAHGVPLALIPLNADQPLNAARCQALGLGRIIGDQDISAEQARAAVVAMLATPGYRQAAGAMRDEMNELPGADHAVELLERLARERRPIL
jgi:UDP:flavonoid glycosyltransferase YjiC (YdhE family)